MARNAFVNPVVDKEEKQNFAWQVYAGVFRQKLLYLWSELVTISFLKTIFLLSFDLTYGNWAKLLGEFYK